MSHFQTTIPYWTIAAIAIIYDIIKGITASPLTSGSSTILLHGVMFGKVIPGSNQLNRSDGCRCLPKNVAEISNEKNMWLH